jgi:hypothetical protein
MQLICPDSRDLISPPLVGSAPSLCCYLFDQDHGVSRSVEGRSRRPAVLRHVAQRRRSIRVHSWASIGWAGGRDCYETFQPGVEAARRRYSVSQLYPITQYIGICHPGGFDSGVNRR